LRQKRKSRPSWKKANNLFIRKNQLKITQPFLIHPDKKELITKTVILKENLMKAALTLVLETKKLKEFRS
jgi:hypothetical protein